MLNLRSLRFLEEVARAGSMRKAAICLNISSSALNRQILALEEQLGTSLFERLPKRLRLTASGEVLIAYAQSMAHEHQRVIDRIAALKGLQRGDVRIATMGGLVNSPLLTLTDKFVERHSRVLIRIGIYPSADAITTQILAGQSDIGLGYNFIPNPALRVLKSLEVEIGIVVSPKHPLAARKVLRLADCLDFPIVTGNATMAIRNVIDYGFASADLPLQPTVETDSVEVIKQFASAGRCVTFLNPMDISAELSRNQLVYLPLKEKKFPTPSLKLVVRAKGALEAASGRLVEEMIDRMQELSQLSTGINSYSDKFHLKSTSSAVTSSSNDETFSAASAKTKPRRNSRPRG